MPSMTSAPQHPSNLIPLARHARETPPGCACAQFIIGDAVQVRLFSGAIVTGTVRGRGFAADHSGVPRVTAYNISVNGTIYTLRPECVMPSQSKGAA